MFYVTDLNEVLKRVLEVLTNFVEIISMALARASIFKSHLFSTFEWKKMGNYFINFLLKYSMSILLVFKDEILKYILYGRKIIVGSCMVLSKHELIEKKIYFLLISVSFVRLTGG